MCAINPAHEIHFKLSVYTSDKSISKDDFVDSVLGTILNMEIHLNSTTKLRWHVSQMKESKDDTNSK